MSVPDRLARWVSSLLVRGPEAPYVLGDLEEVWAADVARGVGRGAARRRYLADSVRSGGSLLRGQILRAGRPVAPVSWLDVKLGCRMLVKYPGLTGVALVALALGIPASVAPLHFLNALNSPLPFEEGERIVGLRQRDVTASRILPGTVQDLEAWRGLSSFTDVGAATPERFNVIAADGRAAPWAGSHMSASSFRIVRTEPQLGRALIDADEAAGAPEVAVIGHELWQAFFAGDPGVLGQTIRIGSVPHTVVGVMPEGFMFPLRDHVWLPLRSRALDHPAGEGPLLWVFGRLRDGVSEEQAVAELRSVHAALADGDPEFYGDACAEVVRFSHLITREQVDGRDLLPMQVFALLLLAIACGNVGTLIMARNAARTGEVALRSALGASRARIIGQFFVESLLLALLATGLGLLLLSLLGRSLDEFLALLELPFWLRFGLNWKTAALALTLAVFSAVIAGVLPAIRATGPAIDGTLRRTGGSRGFGRMTTALVVAEVALAVVCIFMGVVRYRHIPDTASRIDVPLEQFLAAHFSLAGTGGLSEALEGERLGGVQQALVRRLQEEPGVRGVAVSTILPGQNHPDTRIELEGDDGGVLHAVKNAGVAPGFFDGMGEPIRSGRDFTASDVSLEPGATSRAVIVNERLVERVLNGRSAIGRRIRYAPPGAAEPGPWHEIVGVSANLGMIHLFSFSEDDAGFYHPVAPGTIDPVRLAVRVTGDPAGFAPRLRAIAAEVDGEAMIDRPMPLNDILAFNASAFRWVLLVFAIAGGIAIVLSVACLYALMSFTVARRTQEIGVRAALGAQPVRIAAGIARRAFAQIIAGILIAVVGSAFFVITAVPDASATLKDWPLVLAASAAAVLLIGLLACAAPAARALRIRPIEALRVS